nr:MAG TPA: hypothetical protein [Bacteriophage sp.]
MAKTSQPNFRPPTLALNGEQKCTYDVSQTYPIGKGSNEIRYPKRRTEDERN